MVDSHYTRLLLVQSYVLVSDTGDNDHDRATVSILKFPEPEGVGSDLTVAEADIEKLELRYEGFSYDCEALGRCHRGHVKSMLTAH